MSWRLGSLAGVLLSTSLAAAQEPVSTVPPVLPTLAQPAPAAPTAPPMHAPALAGAPCALPAGGCAADARLAGLWAGPSGTGSRVWGSAEYLLWHLSSYRVPPLVTTGPAQVPVGFLGAP